MREWKKFQQILQKKCNNSLIRDRNGLSSSSSNKLLHVFSASTIEMGSEKTSYNFLSYLSNSGVSNMQPARYVCMARVNIKQL